MTTCKWCDASGWFHSLTDNGLCNDCNLRIVNRVQIHARIIRRTLRDLQETNSLDAKLRLAKRVEEEARMLQPFEDSDIRTMTPRPNTLVDQYSEYYRKLNALRSSERQLRNDTLQVEDPDVTSVSVVNTMDPLGTWEEKVVV